MAKNTSLHKAKAEQNDEFYTQISDIEKELKHYREHFKGKTVLCNCDDPRVSNFTRFFIMNFNRLGLKRLITTCYKNQNVDLFSENKAEEAVYMDYYGTKNENGLPDTEEIEIKPLKGDGDFRSRECRELLEQADIVVTNPPFSKFKEFVALLIESNKKFLIIGNQNNVTYKDIFTYIKENKMWLGFNNGDMSFKVPDYYPPKKERFWIDETGQKWRSMGNICWFTNLEHSKRNEEMILFKQYNTEEYPKYENYDAIEVKYKINIPMDYDGVIGVPTTFLNVFNPNQFEILGLSSSARYDPNIVGIPFLGEKDGRPILKGKTLFARIFIRRKK